MTDDIVARLRLYANASIDGGWASVFRADLNIAADEIEQLRGELNAARAEVCFFHPSVCRGAQTAEAYAKARGWDCFKDEDAKAE